jgi:ribulose kinase
MPGWWHSRGGWSAVGSFFGSLSKQSELAHLRQQATGFEEALNEVKTRIQELEKAETTGSLS